MRRFADLFENMKARLLRADTSYLVPAILLCAAIGFGIYLVDSDRRFQLAQAERLEAGKQLSNLAARLQANINANVNLVQGLVSAMSVKPAANQEEFEPLAASIFSHGSQLKVLAGAPDLIIRMVYPAAENRKAFGFNYMSSPEQRVGVLRAKESKFPVLTGPINLVQGGTGLIVRYPVYLRKSDTFWGVISAVVDLQALYHDSGLNSAGSPLSVTLSQGMFGGDRHVFYGDPENLLTGPVEMNFPMGIETWHLSAVPKHGWGSYGPELFRFRLTVFFISISIIVPLLWAALLAKQRQANMRELGRREEQLEILSQRLGLALQASEIGVWEFKPTSGTLIWDERMRELYGVDKAKVICDFDDWKRALHPEDVEEALRVFSRCITHELPYITEFRLIDATGQIRYIRAHGGVYRGKNGEKLIVGANWDITRDVTLQSELRDARDQLEHQSLHDALTGLPNRRYLEKFLNGGSAGHADQKLGLIHADLDHFKEVNDTFGHTTGDGVLKSAAQRIMALLEPGEFASRIGGDEFVIVTMGPDAEQRAKSLAESIVQALGHPIQFRSSLCRIGCSAGIAVQTFRHENPLHLLGNADIALYEAKKRGRSRVEYFSDGLRLAAVETKKTTDELILGLERDEFIPYFQPQFDAVTHEVVGAEALARWSHETRGILTPDKFLAIAEAANKVADLDAVIFEQALFHLARWQANGLDIPSVSVNISAQRLGDERLFESLERLTIKPGTVSFELLETIYIDGSDQALLGAAKRLKAAGIDIEIDDFGSGHASIVSLLELAPKRLKIDRQLVAPILESPSRRQLVSSIIEIGKSQGIEIIAEGVETMEHAAILRDLGCHTLQGYAFAKPMPAAAMMVFLREWKTRKSGMLAVG